MLKACTVIGSNDDERFIVDALRLEALHKSPDEPIHEADLQQMSLLQHSGEPGIALNKQSRSALRMPLVVRGFVTASGGHILKRHVWRQRVKKIQCGPPGRP